MALKAALFHVFVLCVASAIAANLSDANWIGMNNDRGVPTYIRRLFRRKFSSRAGRSAIASEILIASDSDYILWVNARVIGNTNTVLEPGYVQRYCVALNDTFNVFAVSAGTLPPYRLSNPTAFISAITIKYDDDSTDSIVTDTNWRVTVNVPEFQSVEYDDSTWPPAIILASWSGWPYQPLGPLGPPIMTIDNAYWIWTDEVTPGDPPSQAPIGPRAFLKKFYLPSLASSGTVTISAGDGYLLYVNGNLIGSSETPNAAQRWDFTLNPATHEIVVGVLAPNTIRFAGVIAAIAFDSAEPSCTGTVSYISDNTWKFSPLVLSGFQEPGYDDSNWKYAVEEGPYGISPWRDVLVVNGD